MNSLSLTPQETLDLGIPEHVQKLIDSIQINGEWFKKLVKTKEFIYLSNFLQNHPLYGNFYIATDIVSDKVRIELSSFKTANHAGLLKGYFKQVSCKLGDKEFDVNKIHSVINFKHNTVGCFVDDFIQKICKIGHLNDFITILILTQLQTNRINITEFVNKHLIVGKLSIFTYEGFNEHFCNLNGLSENFSVGQNHRLAAIILYNYFVIKLGLDGLFECIEYIDNSNIDYYKRIVDGEKMDEMLECYYDINKEDFKQIILDSFENAYEASKALEKIGSLNFAPGYASHYLIKQTDFNNFFGAYGPLFKAKMLGYFNSKTAKQVFKDKIEQIMIDAKMGKYMNSSNPCYIDYGTRRRC